MGCRSVQNCCVTVVSLYTNGAAWQEGLHELCLLLLDVNAVWIEQGRMQLLQPEQE